MTPLLEVEGLKKHFAIRKGFFSRPWVMSMPSTAFPFRSVAAKRWGWWVSPAAASPRSGALC